MKLRDAKKLKELGSDELEEKLKQFHQELMQFRFEKIRGQVANPMNGRNLRRDIARVETLLAGRDFSEKNKS